MYYCYCLVCLPVQPKSPKEMGLLVAPPWPDGHLYGNTRHLLQSASDYSVNSQTKILTLCEKLHPSSLSSLPQNHTAKMLEALGKKNSGKSSDSFFSFSSL